MLGCRNTLTLSVACYKAPVISPKSMASVCLRGTKEQFGRRPLAVIPHYFLTSGPMNAACPFSQLLPMLAADLGCALTSLSSRARIRRALCRAFLYFVLAHNTVCTRCVHTVRDEAAAPAIWDVEYTHSYTRGTDTFCCPSEAWGQQSVQTQSSPSCSGSAKWRHVHSGLHVGGTQGLSCISGWPCGPVTEVMLHYIVPPLRH